MHRRTYFLHSSRIDILIDVIDEGLDGISIVSNFKASSNSGQVHHLGIILKEGLAPGQKDGLLADLGSGDHTVKRIVEVLITLSLKSNEDFDLLQK